SVYHPDRRETLWAEEGWAAYLTKAEAVEVNHAWRGDETSLNFSSSYLDAADRFNDAASRAIRTRLGDETVRIQLDRAVPGWYAVDDLPVDFVDLPTWALPRLEPGAPLPVATSIPAPDAVPQFRIGDVVYRYASEGWTWERV